MDLHAKDKTQHPENVELLSAQKPITDFKGLLTTIISAVVCFGIYSVLPYSPDANKGIALLIFVAALWFTEAVHITVTALMVPILAVVLGFPDMDIKKSDGRLCRSDDLHLLRRLRAIFIFWICKRIKYFNCSIFIPAIYKRIPSIRFNSFLIP